MINLQGFIRIVNDVFAHNSYKICQALRMFSRDTNHQPNIFSQNNNHQPNMFSQNNRSQFGHNNMFGSSPWLFNNNNSNYSKYPQFQNIHEYNRPFASFLGQKPLMFDHQKSKQQSSKPLFGNSTGQTSLFPSTPLSNQNSAFFQSPQNLRPLAQNSGTSIFANNGYINNQNNKKSYLFDCSCQSIYQWQEKAANLEQEKIELKAKISILQKQNEELKEENSQFMIAHSYKSSRPEHYVVDKHSNFTLRYLPLQKTCQVSELTFKNNKILLEFLSPVPFKGKAIESCVIITEDQCHIIDETWSKTPMRLTIFNIWDYKSQTKMGKQQIVHKIVLEASKEDNFDFDRNTGNLTIQRNL